MKVYDVTFYNKNKEIASFRVQDGINKEDALDKAEDIIVQLPLVWKEYCTCGHHSKVEEVKIWRGNMNIKLIEEDTEDILSGLLILQNNKSARYKVHKHVRDEKANEYIQQKLQGILS